MEKENEFVKPAAEIIMFINDDIITGSGDVKDFEDPEIIPFI